ncbi:MAG: magnesium transporter [Candidatus Thermoplasmatota archaeon]|nr:magnesium transporter [Candidatus Thermoplasmatota archaeon]
MTLVATPLAVFRHSIFSDIKGILKQSFFALIICVLADILTGIFLGSMTETLHLLPGLIIIIPGTIALRGNIFGTLGARLGTYLHTGQASYDLSIRKSPVLAENVLAAIGQTLILSLATGAMASVFSTLLGISSISMSEFLVISMASGLITGAFLMAAAFKISMGSHKKGWDPDNITAPLITTAGDIITIPAIFLSAYLVIGMNASGVGHMVDIVAAVSVAASAGFVIYLVPKKKMMTLIIKQSIPVLLICVVLATFSGLMLEARLDSLILFAALLVMVPPLNGEAGNLGAILASRLSSAALLGTSKVGAIPDREAMKSILAIQILVMLLFPILGVLVHFFAGFAGFSSPGLALMVSVSLLSGIIISAVATAIAYYFTYFSYRIGVDPDNVVIPIITATMDMVGIMVLIFSIGLLLPV